MRVAIKSLEERAVEWLSALVMLWWGCAFALGGSTLSAPAFVAFARFGFSDQTWAAAFALFGGVGLVALYINGRWPRTPYIRMVCSLFRALIWAQVALLLAEPMLKTGVVTTGPGVYVILALFDIISIYRAAFDARYHAS